MSLAPPVLAVLLFAQAPEPAAPRGHQLEAVVRRAQSAVEADRDSSERTYWLARLELDGDRARLAGATIDRLTYRYADASRNYRALADDAHARPATRAYATLGLALMHLQRGHLRDAEPLLRRAVHQLEGPEAAAGRATALVYLAVVIERTVSVDSALATYRLAEEELPPGDAWLRSLLRCNALVARVRSADRGAAALARSESRAALRAGNGRAAAACLAALAQDQERRTWQDSAIQTFEEVAALQRRTRNLSALAVTRQWQGYVQRTKGDLVQARSALEEAVALGRRTETVAAAAWAELTLADLALSFGDVPSAGRYARSAVATFDSTGDRAGLIIARRLEGDAALLNRSYAAARVAYEHVLRDAPAVFPTVAVHARGRLATVSRMEGDWQAAEDMMNSAVLEARRLDMIRWSRDDAYERAILALARGRLDEAAERLQILASEIPERDFASRSDVLTRLGEVHIRAGRVTEGEAALVLAGNLIDDLRDALPDRELRASVVEARYLDWDRDLGFATALAGLATAGRVSVAFRLSEQRRARLLLEGLVRRQALAGLAASPDSLALRGDDELRRLIPDSTAVLAFVAGTGHEPTTVFVLTRDRLMATVVAPTDDHEDDLRRFTGLLAAGVYPRELARRLGAAYFDAALALLPSGITRLVLVPEGPLHRAPLDALLIGADSALMDRYVVTLAPSVAVAAAWWRLPPRTAGRRLLAFGDPAGVRPSWSSDDSVPPRLPVAAREARDVARFSEHADVFTGAEAREARLRSASLSDVGVLHFATHADVGEWSLLQSALLLAPGDGDDGRVTSEDILRLQLGANLVVLSACRSAGGAVRAGEGLFGLTAPLLEAGASSVVASLWPVGDRAIEPMIALLYQELASGATVGDAVNRAKRAARERGLSPAVWAAFAVTGDQRVSTALREPRLPLAALILPLAVLSLAVAYLGVRTTSRRKAEGRRVPSESSAVIHHR
jgi:tetratricopeptide (TPR) repeat protein